MVYFIKHDVIVAESTAKNAGREIRPIARAISLIDVAGAWLAEFTGYKKISEYAITSQDSFKRMYAVAYFFKGFVDKFLNESDFESNNYLSAEQLILHDISWARLSGASFGRSIGWDNVLWTQKKYDAQNFGSKCTAEAAASARTGSL